MGEEDYWVNLEYRVSREFAGMQERRLQYFWCDGFEPSHYLLDDPSPRITGRAWIYNGQEPGEWEFSLILPRRVRSREEVPWAELLPAENVTGWLSFEDANRRIEIDPAAAVPDLL